jgi:hypothetical protein
MHYFAVPFMKKNRKIYNGFQLASAIFMILALMWLTVSAPFINASQQEQAKLHKSANAGNPIAGNEEEAANPFGGTEEKAPGNNGSVSEEYLHDHHIADHFFSIASQYHKCENAGTYIAFHGELLVPPPNVA